MTEFLLSGVRSSYKLLSAVYDILTSLTTRCQNMPISIIMHARHSHRHTPYMPAHHHQHATSPTPHRHTRMPNAAAHRKPRARHTPVTCWTSREGLRGPAARGAWARVGVSTVRAARGRGASRDGAARRERSASACARGADRTIFSGRCCAPTSRSWPRTSAPITTKN